MSQPFPPDARLTRYEGLPLDPLPSDVLAVVQGAIDSGCHVWFKPYLGHEGRARITSLFLEAPAALSEALVAASFKLSARRSNIWRWVADDEGREVHINRTAAVEPARQPEGAP